jgi:O-acetylserine/cysteine efflux transporter
MSKTNEGGSLSPSVLGAALLTVALWGFNFTVIKVGVADVPPLFLVCLRFALSAFPAVFFVPKPKASWGSLAAYGLLLGIGEFGLLFTAMKLGAPAGLSSVMLQSQAFFTAILAAVVLKERIRVHSVVGMIVAAVGLVFMAMPDGGQAAGMTLPLTAMILAAAFFWAAANVVARSMPGTNGLSLMVWSSLFSPVPLLILSVTLEGWESIAASLSHPTATSIGALVYLVVASTLIGYGVWNQLIMRHGAGKIAPFSLLVPVVGVGAAASVLGERFSAQDAAASALVLAGLLIHAFGGRRAGKSRRPGNEA